jgi:hypothetical protein
MFDQISLRKDRLWLYSTGRFAEERRACTRRSKNRPRDAALAA